MKNVHAIIVAICVFAIVLFVLLSSNSRRNIKSITSDLGGGMYRTVTVYDYNGNPIQSWEGKFDVSESENEVYFDDQNGKRVIIHGGIVINQEK